jgi:hypothetical protein
MKDDFNFFLKVEYKYNQAELALATTELGAAQPQLVLKGNLFGWVN